MTKQILTYAFFLIFTHLASAQLMLQEVGGKKKHIIPINTPIDLTFPMKTSGQQPESAFNRYSGYLKNVSKTNIGVVIVYEYRKFIDENGVNTQLTRAIKPPDTPIIIQIPLTQLQSITRHYPKNVNISNIGTSFFLLAIANNIFIAPHLKSPKDKVYRSVGFIAMGVGLSIAIIPNEKKYYLEQPKGKKKRLWQLFGN
jgi:hypothetical protein